MNQKKLRRVLFDAITQQTIALRNDVFLALQRLPLHQRFFVCYKIIFRKFPNLPTPPANLF